MRPNPRTSTKLLPCGPSWALFTRCGAAPGSAGVHFRRRGLCGVASTLVLAPGAASWGGVGARGEGAGGHRLGLGRLLGPVAALNDGAVWWVETQLQGASGQLRVRV